MIESIIALVKAIPILDKWAERFFSAYIDSKIDYSRADLYAYNNKRKVILKQIKEAKNDEERIVFSSILHDLNNRK